jgi:hypothetical protein
MQFLRRQCRKVIVAIFQLLHGRKVGFLVVYETYIFFKFGLSIGGLGHCRILKSYFDDT